MKKIFYTFILVSLFLVACNKPTNDTSVAAPPAPTTQCIPTAATGYAGQGVYNPSNTYSPYGTYNNGYNSAYNTGLNTGVGTGCDSSVYNQYTNYGFTSYPYTSFRNYNWGSGGYGYVPLCDCPANSRPVYNNVIGMGCVAIQNFQPIATGAYFWSLQPNNYQAVNWTQVSNTSGSIGNLNNCYQNFAQSCFTDVANSCGSGFICQATAGGSRLGICRQQ